jgi:hypothetical protein
MLEGIVGGIDNLVNHSKGVGPALMGAGAALTGLGAGLSAFGSKEQASHQQLQAAIQATGHDYEEFGGQIEEAIKHGENFGKSAHETDQALQILTQATHDPQKALDMLGTAFDLSAAKHEDLSTAATQLGRTFNGNTKLLKEFGVVAGPAAVKATKELEAAQKAADTAAEGVTKAHQKLSDVQAQLAGKTHLTVSEQQRLRDAQAGVVTAEAKAQGAADKLTTAHETLDKATAGSGTNITNLSNVLKGQASAASDTFGGKLKALQAKAEDAISAFGQKFGPALQAAGIAMMTFGAMMDAGLGPLLLVIAAVAALIAIGYLLYTNWDTIWGGIQAAVQYVWDWIKEHWPLLLEIFLGPIGFLVVFVIDHFETIKNIIMAAVNFIESVWRWVWGIASTILDSWVGRIQAVISNVVQWIQNVWSPIAGIISWAFNAGVAAIQWVWEHVLQPLISGIGTAFRDAAAVISWVWDAVLKPVWDTFTNVVDWLWNHVAKPAFDGFKAGFQDLGTTVQWIWDHLLKPVFDAFQKVWDWLSGAWDKVTGFISGGGEIVKHILGLQEGGIVTRPTLAVIGEAGPEAVVPLTGPHAPAAFSAGPSVVIENANFAQELDVELFMRRAAWIAQTQRT